MDKRIPLILGACRIQLPVSGYGIADQRGVSDVVRSMLKADIPTGPANACSRPRATGRVSAVDGSLLMQRNRTQAIIFI